MGIVDQGCQCEHCSKLTSQELELARDRWSNGERKIIFESYHHTCGDGCCDDYGTNVYVNGFNLNCDGENVEHVIEHLLEFLQVDNVDIKFEYEDEM